MMQANPQNRQATSQNSNHPFFSFGRIIGAKGKFTSGSTLVLYFLLIISIEPIEIIQKCWWRRRESNPRPETFGKEHLRT